MSSEESRKSKPGDKPGEQKRHAGSEQVKAQGGASPVPAAGEPTQRAPAAAGEAAPQGTEPEQQLAQCRQEIAALQDQLLRKTADFENFRKRMFREREEGVRYANAALITDLIPVIDDFERALQSAAGSRDFASFHSGVEMIERQMVSVLERNWGLKRFSARGGPDGEAFDPEKHEAVAVGEPTSSGDQVVLENYQKGYYLHDRVLRPAKVKVSRPAQNATNGDKGVSNG
jgi:molecular chaperone GrpE